MKRNVIKLFLLFLVIVLSLLFVSSCNETPPETPPETPSETPPDGENEDTPINANLEKIEDEALIEFLINNYSQNPSFQTQDAISSISLVDLYFKIDKEHFIREYEFLESSRAISCYAPKSTIKLVFDKGIKSYLSDSCDSFSFYYLKEYMNLNGLDYKEIGLQFYFSDKGKITAENGDSALVYLGEELTARSSLMEFKIYASCGFALKNGELKISDTNKKYCGNKYIKISSQSESLLSINDFLHYKSIPVDTAIETAVVREHYSYILAFEPQKVEEYLRLLAPALLFNVEKEDKNGESFILERVYDYQKLKEILNFS